MLGSGPPATWSDGEGEAGREHAATRDVLRACRSGGLGEVTEERTPTNARGHGAGVLTCVCNHWGEGPCVLRDKKDHVGRKKRGLKGKNRKKLIKKDKGTMVILLFLSDGRSCFCSKWFTKIVCVPPVEFLSDQKLKKKITSL